MKAEYIETYVEYRRGYPIKTHVYKYRDHTYEVIDAGWIGGQNSLYAQHKAEQDHIDELIEKEKVWSDYKGESAEIGLELFFDQYE